MGTSFYEQKEGNQRRNNESLKKKNFYVNKI